MLSACLYVCCLQCKTVPYWSLRDVLCSSTFRRWTCSPWSRWTVQLLPWFKLSRASSVPPFSVFTNRRPSRSVYFKWPTKKLRMLNFRPSPIRTGYEWQAGANAGEWRLSRAPSPRSPSNCRTGRFCSGNWRQNWPTKKPGSSSLEKSLSDPTGLRIFWARRR